MNYHEDDMLEREPNAQPGEVTVSATTLQYDARAMFDAIARTAAHSLVEQIKRDLTETVAREVRSQINAQVGAVVQSVLDGNVQPTNEWGEPKGAPVALRDMIAKTGREYLGVKVNNEGVATSYNANETRLEHIVGKQVADVFSYQMQTEIKKAVELARAQAVAKVWAVIGDMVIKLGSK